MTIDITGKTAGQLLAEARTLLDQRPEIGEVVSDIEGRRIAAQWLIAEADFMRVAALVEPTLVAGAPARLDVEACPSRIFHAEDQRIVHCDTVNHTYLGGSLYHYAPGLQWSDAGAMPASKPCDKRCARCVERARDALIAAALRLSDDWTLDVPFHMAVTEYRQVMGL